MRALTRILVNIRLEPFAHVIFAAALPAMVAAERAEIDKHLIIYDTPVRRDRRAAEGVEALRGLP